MDNLEQLMIKHSALFRLRESLLKDWIKSEQMLGRHHEEREALEKRLEDIDAECRLISYRLSVLLDNSQE